MNPTYLKHPTLPFKAHIDPSRKDSYIMYEDGTKILRSMKYHELIGFGFEPAKKENKYEFTMSIAPKDYFTLKGGESIGEHLLALGLIVKVE